MKPLQGETGKSGPRIRGMFSAIAPTYDLLNHLLSLSIDRRWRRITVRLALDSLNGSLPDGGRGNGRITRHGEVRILDVATGTGDLALAFARRSGAAARIAGVDFAAPMLQIAREKSDRSEFGQDIVFAEADGHSLPFGDDFFDLATIAFGLRNTEDPDRVLREMARVLRPGGCVAILEFSEPPGALFRGVYHFYFRRVLPVVGGIISRSAAYRYLPASVSAFWSMGEFRRHLRRAGLRPVGSWWLSDGIAGLHIARKT